jgi:hypothetical protein
MSTPRTIEVHIELNAAGDPVAGTIGTGDGPSRPFLGWVELIAALDAARRADNGAVEQSRWR